MSEYQIGSNSAMTVDEITASYRQAKDKKGQIKILAELCSTSKEEIIHILHDAGYVDEKGKFIPSSLIRDTDMPEIVRMRKNGLPLSAIAKKYGVSGQTVSNRLKEWEKVNEVTVPADFVHPPEVTSGITDASEGEVKTKSVKTFEDLRRERFFDGLEIDKDFYKAVLEVCDLLRYIAYIFPGVVMKCAVEKNGSVVASGMLQDLLAEYQGGGPADGDLDEEQA
ncbi:MAG: helix-turn-helix domain-containing protein [Ruminococcaceae bacterium]|nr:helix-turn-helix domain-containing protein [Oscillospiraceae bacterium]